MITFYYTQYAMADDYNVSFKQALLDIDRLQATEIVESLNKDSHEIEKLILDVLDEIGDKLYPQNNIHNNKTANQS